MGRRFVGVLATLSILIVLASCTPPGESDPRPDQTEYATVEEAVASLDTLMADGVSIASGFMSNDLVTSLQGMPCLTCDIPGHLMYFYPAFFWLHYDHEAGELPGDARLATGTYRYDSGLAHWTYEESPSGALSLSWPDATTKQETELRIAWKSTTKVTTYSHPAPILLGSSADAYPFGVEIEVPTQVEITINRGAKQVLYLDVTQTLADTTCGPLAEARSITAEGSFESGAQRVEVTKFSYGHSPDSHFVLELEATAKSGSLVMPIDADLTLTAGGTTRDPASCGLRTIEPPVSGFVALAGGAGQDRVGLDAQWDIEFDDGDYPQATRLNVDEAYLTVGDKRVDVSGFAGLRYLDEEDLLTMVLSFSDGVEIPVMQFVELLTFPALP